jgi:hypothetical protein
MDSIKISSFAVLFIGVAVLLFTFANAYVLLIGVLNIGGSENLINVFGEALAPLITYAIKALYLGVMGWIGSILTRRGVQIATSIPKEGKEETAKAKEAEKTEAKK